MARNRYCPHPSRRTIHPDPPRHSPSQIIRPSIFQLLEPAPEEDLLDGCIHRDGGTKSRWYGESSSRSKSMRGGKLRRNSPSSSLLRMSPLSPYLTLKLKTSFPCWHQHQNHQSYTTSPLWQLPSPRQQGQFTQLRKQQHSWLLNLVESNVKVQELGFSVSPHILVRADDSIIARDDSKWIPPKARSKQRRWSGRNSIRYPT
jgi:hypothetical protein